jgi:uncharacterized protein YqeY
MIERIHREMKEAMKAGDKLKVSVLRMTLSELKNASIAKIGELDEGEILAVIQKAVKKREEAAEAFRNGGRPELAAKEESEGEILRTYLPSMLGKEELEKAIDEVIAETGASGKKDIGTVMKAIMARYRGRVDGREAQGIVASKLV